MLRVNNHLVVFWDKLLAAPLPTNHKFTMHTIMRFLMVCSLVHPNSGLLVLHAGITNS